MQVLFEIGFYGSNITIENYVFLMTVFFINSNFDIDQESAREKRLDALRDVRTSLATAHQIPGALEAQRRRSSSPAPSAATSMKFRNDQLAIVSPRKVQSTALQSPLPRNSIGITRLSGNDSIMP